MFNKNELLQKPNYLLTKFQNEIYRQLIGYMEAQTPVLTQKDIAEKLGVSNAYISQILNGNFNFTLKKLIELGLMIGKVPDINFVDFNEYWRKKTIEATVPNQQPLQKFVAPAGGSKKQLHNNRRRTRKQTTKNTPEVGFI